MSGLRTALRSFFPALLVVGPLLTGCAALTEDVSPEAIPADAMRRPVDMSVVCILTNDDVKSDALVKAMVTGIERFGSIARVLNPDEGPQACSFVLGYEAITNGRSIEGIRFQTFENSIPGWDVTGRAEKGRTLTIDNGAAYTQKLLEERKKKLGARVLETPAAPSSPGVGSVRS